MEQKPPAIPATPSPTWDRKSPSVVDTLFGSGNTFISLNHAVFPSLHYEYATNTTLALDRMSGRFLPTLPRASLRSSRIAKRPVR